MKVVTCLGSLVQSCCGEGGRLQTNTTGVCGECSQCLGHTGFAPAHGVCASQSTLLRLQVALPGNCLKRALGCVHFPGLRLSGSGSRVLHKGADSVGLRFVPFPGPSSSGDQALGECTLPRLRGASYRLPSQPLGFLGAQWERRLRSAVCLLWGAELWLRPSGGCHPSRIPGSLG